MAYQHKHWRMNHGVSLAAERLICAVVGDTWGACAVSLDGQLLTMVGYETIQEHNLPLAKGSLRLTWELYRPNYGNTISIQTGETGCSLPELGITSLSLVLETPPDTCSTAACLELGYQDPRHLSACQVIAP